MFDDNQVTEGSFTIKNKTLIDFLEVNTIKKGYEFTLTAFIVRRKPPVRLGVQYSFSDEKPTKNLL